MEETLKKIYIGFFIFIAVAMGIFIFSLAACKTDSVCNHEWTDWATVYAATCTDEGLEERYCTKCPEVETRAIPIDPDAHEWDSSSTVILESPTCTEEGVKVETCIYCHTTISSIPIPIDPNAHHPNLETGICSLCHSLTYHLGDTGPGGGKIFHISEAGFTMTDTESIAHYLEAAPNDLASRRAWITYGIDWLEIPGTGTAIGTGRNNTALILDEDSTAPAAKACHEFNVAGKIKNDWFLPSSGELYQLYLNKSLVGNFYISPDPEDYTGYYWSSTQSSEVEADDEDDYAFAISRTFRNAESFEFDDYKSELNLVRAIRAF